MLHSQHTEHLSADVVVVGARAAGAATAMLLARRGHRVVLLDRDEFPSDTVSTHQIARSGVVQLARWGLLDAVLASGAPALRQVSLTALDRSGAGETITRPIKEKAGVDLLVAPRRYVLDTLLVEAARAAGADVRTGVRVDSVTPGGVRASGLAVDAPLVVGADGIGSTVARAVGAEVVERRGSNGSAEYAYYAGAPWDGIEMIASPGALAGVFPTHHGEACVWLCRPAAEVRRTRRRHTTREAAFEAELRRHAPELAERLRAGRRTTPVAGMLRCPNFLRRAHGPGWALVGDAGYHRDPVTGHGLSDAFRDAELLAGVIDAGEPLAAYQDRRDRALREVFEITCALADYPPVPEFVALQKRLSVALDAEAEELAATTH